MRWRASRSSSFSPLLVSPSGYCLRTLALLAGWVAVAFLSYRVVNSESVQQILYNPYEILNIKEVRLPPRSSRLERASSRVSPAVCLSDPPAHRVAFLIAVSHRKRDQARLQEALAQVVSPPSMFRACLGGTSSLYHSFPPATLTRSSSTRTTLGPTPRTSSSRLPRRIRRE